LEHLGGFSFRHIDLVECFSAFLITSNAVGADGISVEFFKLLLPLICCHVLHVFNHAIISSIFPSLWKVAIIRPVAKVCTPSGGTGAWHVNSHNLLSDFQSGFRRGRLLWLGLPRIYGGEGQATIINCSPNLSSTFDRLHVKLIFGQNIGFSMPQNTNKIIQKLNVSRRIRKITEREKVDKISNKMVLRNFTS
jgi:hypothetical protein